tara:strand:- start:240 stop:587 length:348 start_codon:yes stop_codon:yes gene_type:complete
LTTNDECPTVLDALNHTPAQLRMFDQFALLRTPFRLHQVGGGTVMASSTYRILVKKNPTPLVTRPSTRLLYRPKCCEHLSEIVDRQGRIVCGGEGEIRFGLDREQPKRAVLGWTI